MRRAALFPGLSFVVVILAAAACASPVASPAVASRTAPATHTSAGLERSPSAGDLHHMVSQRLTDVTDCNRFVSSTSEFFPPEAREFVGWEARIAGLRDNTGWIEHGRLWAGSLESAVAAFEGELIGTDDHGAWIVVEQPEPMGIELGRIETPNSRVMWRREDQVTTACT